MPPLAKMSNHMARIYNNLLFIGVLEWLASWYWSFFASGYRGASTQPTTQHHFDSPNKKVKENRTNLDDNYLAISPRNMFKRTVSAISSALCPVTSLSTFSNAAPRSRAQWVKHSIIAVKFNTNFKKCKFPMMPGSWATRSQTRSQMNTSI